MTPHPASRVPRLLSLSLRILLLALFFGVLSGCQSRDRPGSTAAQGPDDGMTPAEMAQMSGPAAPGSGDIDIAPERLQSVGVRFEKAARRPMIRELRTVGRVAIDERRLARVNVKIEGWIEQLYVNTTGEQVTRGEPLFSLYSPELVATEQEYLLALRSAQTLGNSAVPEVAEGARSLLAATRRRLELWNIADRHIRELEQSGKVQRTLPIHAPLDGTVIEKMAVAGMRVMPGEDLYVIADLSRVWVLADIYEYELPLVRVGQQANITVSYDPAASMTGHLTFIYPTLQSETRTARARFEFENPGGRLKPEMYVNVALSVPLGERLMVPKDAVLESGARSVIFLRQDGGRLAWREVKTGIRAGDQIEILEGLAEGEEIITSANFLIDSESQVKGAMAGMAGMDMPAGNEARPPEEPGMDMTGGEKPQEDMKDMPGMTEPAP
ncbi:MAG: efflux RND transporter periplasmic adaptor subunit [Gammaproteobacteria bacterium]|nr:MAG: efflux RND transporter periplasmic adaptor subunit [Gammaproteobacteria bacterium]